VSQAIDATQTLSQRNEASNINFSATWACDWAAVHAWRRHTWNEGTGNDVGNTRISEGRVNGTLIH
jgi:hypothetical protein